MASTDTPSNRQTSPLRRLPALLGWTRASSTLMGLFLFTVMLIIIVWWPLAAEYLAQVDWQGAWWRQIDWLLIGIFAVMSLLIMAGADLRRDALIILVGTGGGLVIESWGTQTELWVYYTAERPPLWIIPAWPIATLAITRIARILDGLLPQLNERLVRVLYALMLLAFYALMLLFVWPTLDRSLTVMALLLSALVIISVKDTRTAALVFVAGVGLGYFLERWGTTRLCWTYYTKQTPPLFAVLAHGMAALAFWRVERLLRDLAGQVRQRIVLQPAGQSPEPSSSSSSSRLRATRK